MESQQLVHTFQLEEWIDNLVKILQDPLATFLCKLSSEITDEGSSWPAGVISCMLDPHVTVAQDLLDPILRVWILDPSF